MKAIFFLLLSAFVCAAFIHAGFKSDAPEITVGAVKKQLDKKRFAIGCSPDFSLLDFTDSVNAIPLLEGWGQYRMPVTVTNDSANIFFQQGIKMYYGFHIIEAMASFEKALSFDKNFAMAYWGKALAYGPNINDIGYAASPDAILAIQKAKELCNNCSGVEKGLINAMSIRYSLDSNALRDSLNQLYADAMKKVHADFPTNADAAALYADALMVQHPWDLYDKFYEPKPWTPAIVKVLDGLLKEFPENPGANHYYIHAIEGSKHPEKALEVANRLGSFMPGLSHLVHMPSHIYIRSGYYEKGIKVNQDAIKGYDDYLSRYPVVANASFLYLMHNLHMKAACAAMDGQYDNALKYAFETRTSIDSAYLDLGGYWSMYSQYLYMTPLFAQVRFGKWDEIISSVEIPDKRVFAKTMMHFGKGLAYARLHQFDKASDELEHMDDSLSSAQLTEHPPAFNAGTAALEVAQLIVNGAIAEEENQLPKAIDLYKEAVEKENLMLYNEPKDWLLPVRQYLGNVLIKAKQFAAAEKVFKEDLQVNPNNGWALTGLQTALEKLNKKSETAAVHQKLKAAFARSNLKISASVF
ncbi:MAG: hypothetical protein ABIR81_07460 [Ginsengibacter sp.]